MLRGIPVFSLEDPDKIVGGHVLLVDPLVVGWRIVLPSDQEIGRASCRERV